MSISYEQVTEWRKQIENEAREIADGSGLTPEEKTAYVLGVGRGTYQMLQTLKLQCEVEFDFRF
jgi:hypothetical protein